MAVNIQVHDYPTFGRDEDPGANDDANDDGSSVQKAKLPFELGTFIVAITFCEAGIGTGLRHHRSSILEHR